MENSRKQTFLEFLGGFLLWFGLRCFGVETNMGLKTGYFFFSHFSLSGSAMALDSDVILIKIK